MPPTIEEALANHAWLDQATKSLVGIIVELHEVTGDDLPDTTRRAIHEHLRALSGAAIAAPRQTTGALLLLDLLVDRFPPPMPPAR